jgi:hypothetical protein
MAGISHGGPACPYPGVIGDSAAVSPGLRPFQVSADIHDTADHGGVDGVIAGIEADVIVAAQPHPVTPAQLRRGGWPRFRPSLWPHLRALPTVAYWTGEEGDAAGARDQYAALLPVRERVLGAEHPDTLAARADLASCTGEAGDAAGARDQCAALLPIRERVLGAEHPDTLTSRHDLAYWAGQA